MGTWLTDFNAKVLEMVKDPDVSLVLRKGFADFANLPANEQMRFHAWMVTHLLNAQVLYFQLNEGVMHELPAEQILPFNAAILKTKGGAEWWRTA